MADDDSTEALEEMFRRGESPEPVIEPTGPDLAEAALDAITAFKSSAAGDLDDTARVLVAAMNLRPGSMGAIFHALFDLLAEQLLDRDIDPVTWAAGRQEELRQLRDQAAGNQPGAAR